MYRWLQRLFSGPAAAPVQPAPAQPAPRPAAVIPAPADPAPAPAPTLAPARAPEAMPSAPPIPFDQLERINTAWNDWLFERAGSVDGAAEGAEDGGLDM